MPCLKRAETMFYGLPLHAQPLTKAYLGAAGLRLAGLSGRSVKGFRHLGWSAKRLSWGYGSLCARNQQRKGRSQDPIAGDTCVSLILPKPRCVQVGTLRDIYTPRHGERGTRHSSRERCVAVQVAHYRASGSTAPDELRTPDISSPIVVSMGRQS